jgi:hypothetical protein
MKRLPIISSSLVQDLLRNYHQLNEEEKKELTEIIQIVCQHKPEVINQR